MSTSQIVLAASDLQELIDVCAVTLAPASADDQNYTSIYLTTVRRPYGDYGEATLLTGMSSTVIAAGIYSVVADGELKDPWLLSSASRTELSPVLKSWVKEFGDPQVVMRVDGSGATTVQVEGSAERSLRFLMEPADMWPLDEVMGMISGSSATADVYDKDEHPLPAGKRMMFSSKAVETMVKISKKIRRDVSIIPVLHPASIILMECGEWRGGLLAAEYPYDIEVDEPGVELVDPREDEVVNSKSLDSVTITDIDGNDLGARIERGSRSADAVDTDADDSDDSSRPELV